MGNDLIVYVCGCEHTSQADSHNCGWLEHHAVTGYVCLGCDQPVRAVNITTLERIRTAVELYEANSCAPRADAEILAAHDVFLETYAAIVEADHE